MASGSFSRGRESAVCTDWVLRSHAAIAGAKRPAMASMGQRRPAAAPAAAPRPSGAGCGQGEPQGFFGREQSNRRQKKGAPAPGSQRGTTSPRPLAKRRGTLVGSEQSERGAAFSGRRTSARRGTKFPAAPERGSPAHSVGEGPAQREGAGASEARSEAKARKCVR